MSQIMHDDSPVKPDLIQEWTAVTEIVNIQRDCVAISVRVYCLKNACRAVMHKRTNHITAEDQLNRTVASA